MGKWKDTIGLSDPVIVSCVILMVMGVDDGMEIWKFITDLEEPSMAIGKTRIDEEPIDVESINLEQRDSKKSARHVDGTYRTILFKVNRKSAHRLLDQ